MFGADRFAAVCGDSRETLAAYEHAPGDAPFDWAFVDGLHTLEGARSDLRHARRLSAAGATVVLDDCNGAVRDAWTAEVEEGHIVEHHRGLGWHGMCIGRFA